MSLDLSSLQYQRTYTAAGVIAGDGPPGQREARVAGAGEGLQQAAIFQQESLDYARLDLQIEGDVSLLEDYFGAEDTAQRIFDHVWSAGSDGRRRRGLRCHRC